MALDVCPRTSADGSTSYKLRSRSPLQSNPVENQLKQMLNGSGRKDSGSRLEGAQEETMAVMQARQLFKMLGVIEF
jgi:hypothetical protein